MIARITCLLAGLLATTSCSNRKQEVNLNEVYRDAAQRSYNERNPVIVIPGILGSKLIDEETQTIVWGAFVKKASNPKVPAQARMIALPMQPGASLLSLKDSTRENGALDRLKVTVLPGISVAPKAYLQILQTLGVGGYVDQTLGESGAIDYGSDHYSCFQFSYDWRRSSAENAVLLGEFIADRKRYVEAENLKRFGSKGRVKFDIVAHSMGGLVARYYLRYGAQGMPAKGKPVLNWSGKKNIEKLILIGTPNAGSTLALTELTKGIKLVPLRPGYPPAILGTMPAIYELLPRTRHKTLIDETTGDPLDILDFELWKERQWGLANPRDDKNLERLLPNTTREERVAIAHDHLQKCLLNARRFHEALDLDAKKPDGISLSLYAGDATHTPTVLAAEPFEPKEVEWSAGDGTVARYSAIMDERFRGEPSNDKVRTPIDWDHVKFLFESHIELTQSKAFADNVLFQLLDFEPKR